MEPQRMKYYHSTTTPPQTETKTTTTTVAVAERNPRISHPTLSMLLLFLLIQVPMVDSLVNLSSTSLSSSTTTTSVDLPSGSLPTGDSSSDSDSSSTSIQEPLGFYVHIPYCRKRCRYCNFAIVPVGNTETPPTNTNTNTVTSSSSSSSSFRDVIHERYQSDLFQEIDLLRSQQKQGPSTNTCTATTTANTPSTKSTTISRPLTSIYFGGGTPSLAPISMIQEILQKIKSTFVLSDQVEVTMEMDPGTFDLRYLQAIKDLGINRISLGVQSFDDTILESLGRVHRMVDIYHAIQLLHQVYGSTINENDDDHDNHGILKYSMDLISGLPGLTEAKWIETLQIATSKEFASVSHLSIYDLQVEEGTVFGRWYGKDTTTTAATPSSLPTRPSLPNEESVARMYKFTAGYLRAKGFEHYEVSSYARNDDKKNQKRGSTTNPHRSQHNQLYWRPSGSWYAVGLGATSCIDGRLVARPKTMADYHTWVVQQQQQLVHNSQTISEEESPTLITVDERPSEEEWLTDVILKRLRTSDGLDLDWIEERFGPNTRRTIVMGAQLGLDLKMAELDPSGSRLRLTDPDGFLYSNYIISSIFAELGYDG